jgi:hypothetical protein
MSRVYRFDLGVEVRLYAHYRFEASLQRVSEGIELCGHLDILKDHQSRVSPVNAPVITHVDVQEIIDVLEDPQQKFRVVLTLTIRLFLDLISIMSGVLKLGSKGTQAIA